MFSSTLVASATDDPRKTWIKYLYVEVNQPLQGHRRGGSFDMEESALCDLMTVVFMHCRLREFHLRDANGMAFRMGPLAALAGISRDTLTSISVPLDNCQDSLHIISRIHSLRSLDITMIGFPTFNHDSKLIMPNLSNFNFKWLRVANGPEVFHMMLEMLSASRFDDRCRIALQFRMKISASLTRVLDPIFRNHHSDLLELYFEGDFHSQAVFENARRVVFGHIPPAHNFFDLPRLPAVIVFRLGEEHAVQRLWGVLDVLVANPHAYATCIQVFACIQWSDSAVEPVHFTWDCPLETQSPQNMHMTLKLMRYSRSLAPKGIVLADSDGVALEQRKRSVVSLR